VIEDGCSFCSRLVRKVSVEQNEREIEALLAKVVASQDFVRFISTNDAEKINAAGIA
jgi:hypothetical protein